MRNDKRDDIGDFAFLIREGDGARLWEKFHLEAMSQGHPPVPSSPEIRFLLQLDNVVAKHRFAIATAHGRYLLRKWTAPLRRRYASYGSVVRLPVPEPPATM